MLVKGEVGRLQAEIDRQLRVENDLRRQIREREQTINEIQEVKSEPCILMTIRLLKTTFETRAG